MEQPRRSDKVGGRRQPRRAQVLCGRPARPLRAQLRDALDVPRLTRMRVLRQDQEPARRACRVRKYTSEFTRPTSPQFLTSSPRRAGRGREWLLTSAALHPGATSRGHVHRGDLQPYVLGAVILCASGCSPKRAVLHAGASLASRSRSSRSSSAARPTTAAARARPSRGSYLLSIRIAPLHTIGMGDEDVDGL